MNTKLIVRCLFSRNSLRLLFTKSLQKVFTNYILLNLNEIHKITTMPYSYVHRSLTDSARTVDLVNMLPGPGENISLALVMSNVHNAHRSSNYKQQDSDR